MDQLVKDYIKEDISPTLKKEYETEKTRKMLITEQLKRSVL